MKKLLFVASALAALSLLAPSSGFAQQADNQVGIYFDTDGMTNEIAIGASTPFNAYLVITQPVGNGGTPVTAIDAFEVQVSFTNGAGIFKLSEVLPTGSINIGDTSSPAAGLEYVVGIAVAVPVVSGSVSLLTLQLMVLATDQNDIFVGNSSLGNMYYQNRIDADNFELVDYYASSGDSADPVASINGTALATDSETWGSVKSLYR